MCACIERLGWGGREGGPIRKKDMQRRGRANKRVKGGNTEGPKYGQTGRAVRGGLDAARLPCSGWGSGGAGALTLGRP